MRVRFTSPHPKDFTEDVLVAMQRNPNIVRALHLPAQASAALTLNSITLTLTLKMRSAFWQEVHRN